MYRGVCVGALRAGTLAKRKVERSMVYEIPVHPDEARYLLEALMQSMPLEAGDRLDICSDDMTETASLRVERSCDPLSLEQRRFLTAHGFSFRFVGVW